MSKTADLEAARTRIKELENERTRLQTARISDAEKIGRWMCEATKWRNLAERRGHPYPLESQT
jgi:hypothetical protein